MRRIVTGYDDEGKATIAAVNQLAAAAPEGKDSELLYFWRTFGGHTVPVPAGDPTEGMTDFFPPADGTTCIVGLIPPGGQVPLHLTDSTDYGILISGNVWLVMEDGSEVELQPGDCVIQTGGLHAWENRGDTTSTMYFVMVGAERKAATD
ncbi:MAG: cupin domain-containing protein [Anaerolineales bacterium]|nr:cupin domain-containing protein [Anaerolineales bacterium]